MILRWFTTLGGRVTLALLLSLLLAQVASTFVLVDHHESRRMEEQATEFFANLINTERMMISDPGTDITAHLESISRGGFEYWVGGAPSVEDGLTPQRNWPQIVPLWNSAAAADRRYAWYPDVRPFWMHYRVFDPKSMAPSPNEMMNGADRVVPGDGPPRQGRPPGPMAGGQRPPPDGMGNPPPRLAMNGFGPEGPRADMPPGGGMPLMPGVNGPPPEGARPPGGGAIAAAMPGGPPRFPQQRPQIYGDATPRNPRSGPNAPPVSWRAALRLPDGRWLNAEYLQMGGIAPWFNVVIEQNLILLAVMTLSVLAVMGFATKRLRILASAADKVGRGETLEPIPEGGTSEVRQLTQSFNTMSLRLRRFIEARTQMLGAISHDLRTPITGLRLRAELVDDDENRDRMLAIIDELHHLTEATLALAKDESFTEASDKVDLSSLIESICDDLTDIGIDVTCDIARGVHLTCRHFSLRRAIRNLAENGAKYGHRSRITMNVVSGTVQIMIDDDGPGIPNDQLERVLLPFVRLENSRSRQTGGAGLGLAITRSIVLNHGGELQLKNRPEGGLRATITLPLGT